MKALPGFICASNLALKKVGHANAPGNDGYVFEDTFELFALKVEICFKRECRQCSSISFASHTVPFQKQWLCLLQSLVAVPSIVGDED